MIKNMKPAELSNGFLEYTNIKDDLIEYKCSCCNKSCQVCLENLK